MPVPEWWRKDRDLPELTVRHLNHLLYGSGKSPVKAKTHENGNTVAVTCTDMAGSPNGLNFLKTGAYSESCEPRNKSASMAWRV
ncbi:hypothetical protein B1400_1366 [Bifidobacterium italicum]|uniref:Uncharacterized protein n=1 Tax=Bifidobacterium italicum TaxID=1960968 RepID=A0A2A2EIM0_9BIFI|nr:hypothetical protein B1400_1366 [Bifidobacterium italicum]